MPSAVAQGQTWAMGYKPHGFTPGYRSLPGRFRDFAIDETPDGSFLFTWDLEIAERLAGAYAVYIYENGTFLVRIGATSGNFEWTYVPDETENAEEIERWNFDFILAPSDSRNEALPWVRELNLQNRIRLSYKLPAGPVAKVSIYKNPPNEAEVDTEVSVHDFHAPILETDNADVTLGGRWQGADEVSEIACVISVPGNPGTAVLVWTYGDETGTLRLETYSQELFNGILLAFEDRLWTAGEDFSIFVRFPTEWITGRVGNGTHTFQVGTFNDSGHRILSDEMVSLSVVKVPPSPTLLDSEYLGSGNATILWRLPSDPDLLAYRVYRNYPAADIETLHPQPIEKEDASPGQILEFAATGLQPGLNRFVCRVQNSTEREENLNYVEFLLDGALDEITNPNPPIDVTARLESDGTLTVTILADASSDLVTVYHDNQAGTIDYGTAWATVANPQLSGRQTLTIPGLYLPDGVYLIGGRATSGTTEEENEILFDEIEIDTTTPPMAYDLAVELVN